MKIASDAQAAGELEDRSIRPVVFAPPASHGARMPLALRCREITPTDIVSVTGLLTRGFAPPRLKKLFLRGGQAPTREFWVKAFKRLSEFPTPPGFPRYGYLLECDGNVVGVVLIIASVVDVGGRRKVRCNLSSWYVEPAFRCYATMLVSRILRNSEATYINITPSHRTFEMLRAQGFVKYCAGRFISLPALSGGVRADGVEVRAAAADDPDHAALPDAELLLAHAGYGCISVVCHWQGQQFPFVFLPLREAGIIPFAYLAYCRSVPDFVRLAKPLGRFLLRRGIPAVVIDTNGPIAGLVGKYIGNAPKFYKGADPPRLGDMAYSERALFGF